MLNANMKGSGSVSYRLFWLRANSCRGSLYIVASVKLDTMLYDIQHLLDKGAKCAI